MPFDFFDRKVCLTLVDEEWCAAQNEFARVGLTDYLKFEALGDIGPHQSFNKSTKAILSEFWASGSDSLLFLEDDCVFQDLGHLEQALSELPENWDIVYLGANLLNGTPERYSDHLFRVREAWTTHCIGYSRRVVPFLLQNQPGFSEEMFDCWMSRQLKDLNAFAVAPMVAYQRPHVSSIWQKPQVEDYTPIFEASQERLR